MLFFAFRRLSGKQKNNYFCALCVSNERSEWAVKFYLNFNYPISNIQN